MLAALGHCAKGNAAEPQSQWVHFDARGKLVYQTTERGDRIMDFSFAGYMGGGVKLPTVPVKATVDASGKDDTAAIQEAIDTVAKLPLVDGFRGAVRLKPGNFKCQEALRINTSGEVLRGSGTNATTIAMSGRAHACVVISGSHASETIGEPVMIIDAYVPSGTDSFHVSDATSFKVGDTVRISRPVTKDWLHFMGMDTLVREGRKQTWISGETVTQRTIRGINGNQIMLDMPLTDSLDAKYVSPPGGSMVKCGVTGDISQAGVENLRIVSPPQSVTITSPQYKAITINSATDVWVREVDVMDTINSVLIGGCGESRDGGEGVHSSFGRDAGRGEACGFHVGWDAGVVQSLLGLGEQSVLFCDRGAGRGADCFVELHVSGRWTHSTACALGDGLAGG